MDRSGRPKRESEVLRLIQQSINFQLEDILSSRGLSLKQLEEQSLDSL